MFYIGPTSDYVKSVYELVMLVVIAAKVRGEFSGLVEGSRSVLFSILIVN
jgi:hypothetical protein